MRRFFGKYWWVIPIAIIVILVLAVVVQFTKDTNGVAEWVFNFLKEWAVILGAAVTLLLVIVAFITLKTTTEQRRKSITPSLQIDHISYWYETVGLPNIRKRAILPGIELQIKNVGTGPALTLQISAFAMINVNRGDLLKGSFCRLHWDLTDTSKDVYLGGHTLDPVSIRLNLVQVDRIAPAYKIAQLYKATLKKSKEETPEELKHEMNFQLRYEDLDHSLLTDQKTIHIGNDIFALRFDKDDVRLIPGDPGYPENIPASF